MLNILLLFTCLFSEPAIGQENLLTNPGFESGAYNSKGPPQGWYRSGSNEDADYQWIKGKGRKGSKCVYLANGKLRAGLSHVSLPINPKKTYKLSGWVKTKGLENGQIWIRAIVGGRGVKSQHYVIKVAASNKWTCFSTPVVDMDPKTSKVTIMVQIRPDAKGEAWIDDIFFGEEARKPFVSPYPVPKLSGARPKTRLEKSDFFRVEQVEGVWWLVKPDGELFWSVGANTTGGVNPILLKNLLTQLDGRDRKTAETNYITQQMERARSWGFNSLGGWSTLSLSGFDIQDWNKKEPLYYFVSLNCCNAGLSDKEGIRKGVFLVDINGDTQVKGQGHRMVDPFNPQWKERLERYIERTIKPYKHDKNCIGYFTDNEIAMGFMHKHMWGPHAISAFVELLKSRYPSVKALNKAWSTRENVYQYKSISPKELRKKPPVFYYGSKVMDEDLKAFEVLLVRTYMDTVISTIRKHDPNHMLLFNRFATANSDILPHVEHLLPELARFDIIAANLYPHPENGEAVADYNGRKALEWTTALNKYSGRPVLIGEFGTASREAGLLVRRWRPRTLDTDAQRGESYKKMIYTWYNLPFTVGAHWFRWDNGYGFGDNLMNDPRNCGLIDDHDQPYPDLLKAVREAHRAINDAGRRADFTLDDLPLPK